MIKVGRFQIQDRDYYDSEEEYNEAYDAALYYSELEYDASKEENIGKEGE